MTADTHRGETDRVTVIHEQSKQAQEAAGFSIHPDRTSVTFEEAPSIPISLGDTYYVVIGDDSVTMDLQRRMTDMDMNTVLRFTP